LASRAVLENEILGYISEFIKILDQSNKLFLLSRFAKNEKRRRYYLQLWQEIQPKANLIESEITKLLPLIEELTNG